MMFKSLPIWRPSRIIQQRIASDLHDSTCQHLIAASLGLMRLRREMSDAVGAERLCGEIDASIDEALLSMRHSGKSVPFPICYTPRI